MIAKKMHYVEIHCSSIEHKTGSTVKVAKLLGCISRPCFLSLHFHSPNAVKKRSPSSHRAPVALKLFTPAPPHKTFQL